MTAVDPNLFEREKILSPYKSIISPLETSLGNNRRSRERDVINTRRKFNFLESESGGNDDYGVIDKKLDETIRRFQRSNGLKEDGVMHPGGETEYALNKALIRHVTPVPSHKPLPPLPKRKPDSESGISMGDVMNELSDVADATKNIGRLVGSSILKRFLFFKRTVRADAGKYGS